MLRTSLADYLERDYMKITAYNIYDTTITYKQLKERTVKW